MDETGKRRSIDQFVVGAHRQAEYLAGSRLARYCRSPGCNSSHYNGEVVDAGRTETPAGTAAEHPDGRHEHRSGVSLGKPRGPEKDAIDRPAEKTGQAQKEPAACPKRRRQGMHARALNRPDLVADLPHIAAVDPLYDVGKRKRSAVDLDLHDRGRVHIVEKHDSAEPVTESVDLWVGGNRSSEACENECCEREGLPGALAVFAKQVARTSHVELEQTVHHRLAVAQVKGVENQASLWRKRDAPASTPA